MIKLNLMRESKLMFCWKKSDNFITLISKIMSLGIKDYSIKINNLSLSMNKY